MKKSIFTLLLLLPIISYSQNRYTNYSASEYQPRSFNEMASVAMSLRQKYDENQKYLYSLKKGIIELKGAISEQSFINQLDQKFKELSYLEGGDLARSTSELNQIEVDLLNIISNYKIWDSQKKQSTTNTYNSNGYLFITSANTSYGLNLYSEPNIDSRIIHVCQGECEVMVIDNSGEIYFKVVVNGYSGYVNKYSLKRQW
ncbi:SH3 domain-containing protein [Myroides odoratimimus]|nr:SH3 domain-containing protein [Myroides odoratimimus]